MEQLVATPQAATHLGLAETTLRKWRIAGTGPRFVKMGERAVRYRLADIDAWVASRIARSTSEAR